MFNFFSGSMETKLPNSTLDAITLYLLYYFNKEPLYSCQFVIQIIQNNRAFHHNISD
jgi:hypothetical protein